MRKYRLIAASSQDTEIDIAGAGAATGALQILSAKLYRTGKPLMASAATIMIRRRGQRFNKDAASDDGIRGVLSQLLGPLFRNTENALICLLTNFSRMPVFDYGVLSSVNICYREEMAGISPPTCSSDGDNICTMCDFFKARAAARGVMVPPCRQSRLPRGRVPGAFHHPRGVSLNRAGFEAFLPDRKGLGALVSLIRAYVGWGPNFVINFILAYTEIPAPRMAGAGIAGASELGRTSWLPSPTGR